MSGHNGRRARSDKSERKVIFGGANSLDNFIARPDGAVDWLLWSSDVTAIMTEFWKRLDTIIWGRKTYEVAARSGGTGSSPGIKNYLCSRTMKKGSDNQIELNRDAVKLVRDLKKKPGKDICIMGGGDLARSLFEAGLIDEIGLNIHPVLLGSGVPLFHPMKRQIDLELLECKQLKKDCVLVTYGVKKSVSASRNKRRRGK